jgi:hypothetical protein
MAISTNLNASPYFDDFNVSKDYYRVLFKPSTSVQVRELNQLQAILQNQIEKFGDNIFRRGTIIDGCNFQFNNALSYVKILDSETSGFTAIPSLYVGNFVKNSKNLVGIIVNSADGFESADPNLKTLYVNYTNSGDTFEETTFQTSDLLTVYSPLNSIYSIEIINGGTAFSNSDLVIFTPVIAVTETSGQYQEGDFIVDTLTGANAEIVQIDRVTLSSLNQTLIKYKPSVTQLTDSDFTANSWTYGVDSVVTNPAQTVSATINRIFGQSAAGRVVTAGDGSILSVTMTDRGRDYTYTPFVSVQSDGNISGVNTLNLLARNYIAKITVASSNSAIGNAYAFSVTEGTIYQKGHFLRVNPQTVIVSRYSDRPSNVAVGFTTNEFIVDSNVDTSLLDNALDTENVTAPGADRLNLVPELIVVSKDVAAANSEFLSLVEWNDGNPYKQNQVTQYNRIGDEIARAISDSSGNFVLDSFQVVTSSPANTANEGRFYSTIIDPGQAYISGKKVQVRSNFVLDLEKGTDTKISNNIISLNYGNYVKLKEVAGVFSFSTGDDVALYDLQQGYYSNNLTSIAPIGNQIGTAKMRSMIYDEGSVGSANSVYRLYLFDVTMNAGKNFADVRSVYYNDNVSIEGIADVVTYVDPSTQNSVARLEGVKDNRLIFSSGVDSLKNSNNTTYTYRTVFTTDTSVGNNGVLTKSIASVPNEFFPYTGTLTNSQKLELYVVPVGNNLIQYNQLTGNVSINTTSNVVTGSGTSFFDDFEEGDYVYVSTPDLTSANSIRKVVKLNSSTSLQVDRPFDFANTTAIFKRVFPQNIPVPFGTRDGLSANVDINGNILTLKFAHANGTSITFEGTSSVNTAVGINVQRRNVTSSTKTANRNKYVKLSLANNEGNTTGPWCIGVPDAFRLRNVYVSNNVSVNTSSPNITSQFYIDHNQNSNYLGLGWLYKNPSSSLSLDANDFLLVEFDYYTRNAEGYFDTVSYTHTANSQQIAENDAKILADLSDESNSFEVPEVYTYAGEYYDLLNQFDFRPAVANTVSPTDDPTSAPVNPSYSETFDQVTDKKFPYPDSSCISQIEQYLGRVDDIYIGEEGNIYALKGIPDVNPKKRFTSNHPKDSLRLQTISVPAYPTVGQILSDQMSLILDKKIGNETLLNKRLPSRVATPILTTTSMQHSQPMLYTMEDIGNLERRIRDLEYYVSLSVLETNITNKIIPSSIDQNINRFKFGFFADDFATKLYTDINNPQYSASVEVEGDLSFGMFSSPTDSGSGVANKSELASANSTPYPSQISQKSTNRIVPKKFVWAINQYIGENIPYVDHVILEQNIATTEPVIVVPNTNIGNTTSNNIANTIANTCIPRVITTRTPVTTQSNTLTPFFNAGYLVGVQNNEVSGISIPPDVNQVTMFITARVPVIIEIFNSFNDRFATAENVQRLSSSERAQLGYPENLYSASNPAQIPILFGTSGLNFNYSMYTTSIPISSSPNFNVTRLNPPRDAIRRYEYRGARSIDDPLLERYFMFQGIGKITFNSPDDRFVRIVVRIASSFLTDQTLLSNDSADYRFARQTFGWSYSLNTRANITTFIESTTVNVQDCTPINPPDPVYRGTMTARGLTNWSCSNQFRTTLDKSQYTGFILNCTGLKPNTKHNFFLDGKNYNEFSYPRSTFANEEDFGFRRSQNLSDLQLGSYDLISDSSGKLSFTIYVPIQQTNWIINQLGLTGGIYSSSGATQGSSGYSNLTVRDPSDRSFATLVVADRAPNKVLPNDAAGNI